MEKRIIISLILIIVFISILLYFSTTRTKPEDEIRDFIQTSLKQEFWPSEKINLTLGYSPFIEEEKKYFYGFMWDTGKEKLYARIDYNRDNRTISHFTLMIFSIKNNENRTVNDYLSVPGIEWKCSVEGKPPIKTCKASRVQEKTRLDVIINYVGGRINSITLCEMKKESEVYNLVCGRS